MRLDQLKKELRYISFEDRKNDAVSDFSGANCTDITKDILARANNVNIVKKLYDAYKAHLHLSTNLHWIDLGVKSREHNYKLNYFGILYPEIEQLASAVSTYIIPELKNAGFEDLGIRYLTTNCARQGFYYCGEVYYVYYVSSVTQLMYSEDYALSMEMTMSVILFRLFTHDLDPLADDYRYLAFLSKGNNYSGSKVLKITENCFDMHVYDFIYLYASNKKRLTEKGAKVRVMSINEREEFFTLLDTLFTINFNTLDKYTVEQRIAQLDKIVHEPVIVADEAALAMHGLIRKCDWPLTILTKPDTQFISCGAYITRFSDDFNKIEGCTKPSYVDHIYLMSKERALIEYAITNTFDLEILSEAILNYLEYAMSLDYLYDEAKELEVEEKFVDAMICTALTYAPVQTINQML